MLFVYIKLDEGDKKKLDYTINIKKFIQFFY